MSVRAMTLPRPATPLHDRPSPRRWIQISEVAKVLMIIVLAKFFADRRASIGSPLTMLLGLALLAPAVLLVYRQPDLGTSLVFIAIFFGIAFLAGARIWQLVALVAIAAASFPVV